MNARRFNRKVANKMKSLKRIMSKGEPVNPNILERHKEIVKNASQYFEELKNIFFEADEEIYMLSKDEFYRKVDEQNDFCTIEDEGNYFSIAYISNLPESYYIVWFLPMSEI